MHTKLVLTSGTAFFGGFSGGLLLISSLLFSLDLILGDVELLRLLEQVLHLRL